MAAIDPNAATIPLDATEDIEALTIQDPSVDLSYAPADLPDVDLSDEMREEIEVWLGEQLSDAKSRRQGVEDRWSEIQKLYEMTELEESKDFPFEGSAHLVIPIIATFTETIWAKIVNTIFASEDVFTARPRRKDFVDAARPFQRYINTCMHEEIHIQDVGGSLFLELTKLGTCVAKTIYTVEKRTVMQYNPATNDYEELVVTTKDQPEVIHVQLADFFFPLEARSLEEASWKAHRVRLNWGKIKAREEEGIFKDVDRIKEETKRAGTEYERARMENEDIEPAKTDEFEIFEVWFEYPIKKEDGDEVPYKLVAFFNADAGVLLRIQHNWYPLQMDPFDACPYIPREHRILGLGPGDMCVPFQKEISTMHNQRLDAGTLANSDLILIRADSLLPLNFKARPGLTLPVDDVDRDIRIVPLGRQYNSTIQDEQHTLQLLQQRVGIHEYTQMPQGGTPATTTIAIMQESTRRFDIVIRNVRSFLGKIVEKIILLKHQYYLPGQAYDYLGDDGRFVEQILSLTARDLRAGIALAVTATTSTTSKELERQAKLSLFNLITQYYGQLTQYIVQSENPQVPPVISAALREIVDGLSRLVGEILDDFDIRNREQFVIELDRIRNEAATLQAGQNSVSGNAGQPRMENLQQLLATAANGSGASTSGSRA